MSLRCTLIVCINGETRHKDVIVHTTRELRRTIRALRHIARQGKCDWFCIMVQGDYIYQPA